MSRLSELVGRHQGTSEKLSSSADFAVLDELLCSAIEPMEAETEAFREWLGEVATFTMTSRRRPNDALVSACVSALCGTAGAARALVASGIDRGHVFSLLNRASPLGASLEAAQVEYIRRHGHRVPTEVLEELRRTKDALGARPGVVPAMRTARYWHELALRRKADIISHYMRLLLKVSSRVSHASGNRVEAEPAFNDAYVTASNAVDRFRSEQGVFASYLGVCLKGSTRQSAAQALGLAAPGARVTSADALQADGIEGALEIGDASVGVIDPSLVHRIDAVAGDADVRAALMVSDWVPPTAARLRDDAGSKPSTKSNLKSTGAAA